MRSTKRIIVAFFLLLPLVGFSHCGLPAPSPSNIPSKFSPIFPTIVIQCGNVGCVQ